MIDRDGSSPLPGIETGKVARYNIMTNGIESNYGDTKDLKKATIVEHFLLRL
jgi:hypothetical protein